LKYKALEKYLPQYDDQYKSQIVSSASKIKNLRTEQTNEEIFESITSKCRDQASASAKVGYQKVKSVLE